MSRKTLLLEVVANCVRVDMGEKFILEINSSFDMASCKLKCSKFPILW